VAGGDQLGNDFQAAHQIVETIRLGEAAMTARIGERDIGDIAGDVEDTERAEVGELRGDLGAETTVSHPHVDNGKIRLILPAECDRLLDGAADTANLITMLDQNVLAHVGDHEIVFGNKNLEHGQSPWARQQTALDRLA
jgi:hypothetical protein